MTQTPTPTPVDPGGWPDPIWGDAPDAITYIPAPDTAPMPAGPEDPTPVDLPVVEPTPAANPTPDGGTTP